MLSEALHCWNCGADLAHLPLPFSRRDVCRACEADVHVCRMCRQMDTTAAKSCREPTVEEVRDKQRSNFCDLFSPDPSAYERDPDGGARQAQQQLQALFGVADSAGANASKPDADALLKQRESHAAKARNELEELFGIDKQ